MRGKDLVLVLDAGLLLANAVPRRHDVGETTRRDDVVVQFRNRVEIAQIEERVAGADVVPAVGAVDLDGDVPRGVPERLEDPDARDHLELVALDGLSLVGGLESERGILVGLVVQGDRVLGELVLAPVDEDPGVVELLEIVGMVPVQVREDHDVDVTARVPHAPEHALDVLPLVLPGAGMVVLVGPFRPGHSGVDEDEPVTSLDEESVVRKRNLLVRDVLQVGLRREVEMVLKRLGRDEPGVQRPDRQVRCHFASPKRSCGWCRHGALRHGGSPSAPVLLRHDQVISGE